MQNMVSVDTKECLTGLGSRLRQARLELNEAQAGFASRLGVSIPTLRKMEKGDTSVKIGLWAEALYILNKMSDLDDVLKKQGTLFDRWEEQQSKIRQRASKRKILYD